MNELGNPDLDLIKQENQGCGRRLKTCAYILLGVDEGYNQCMRSCC